MKRNSFLFLILITLFKATILFSQSIVKFEPGNLPFNNPTPGEISIVACTPIPSTLEANKTAYRDVVDCGFNLATATGSDTYLKKQFESLEGLKLKLMIGSGSLRNNDYKSFINTFKNYSQLGAWIFYDEPQYDKLNELKGWYDKIYQLDNEHLIFINLVGAQIKIFTGNTKDYAQYLNLIQKTFHPALWSYDLYPLSLKNGKLTVSYDLFYSDLEMVSAMAKKTSRPFWAFCQSMGFKNKAVQRPDPKEEYLRFEAFSALAYGAQGIVYWTYSQRKNTSSESYYSSLVDLNGKKTKAWYAAQNVNREIIKFNNVFYGCEVKEVKHTGTKSYKDTKKLTGTFGPFSSIKSGNVGVLVSRIINEGKEYIVIVNHDINNSQNITLSKGNDRKFNFLTQHQGMKQTGKDFTFKLEKGGYAIIACVS